MIQWYYAIGGQRVGPVSAAEFDQLVAGGTITSETLVWHEGLAGWKPHRELVSGAEAPADSEICAVSGQRYPRREMIQYEGRWIAAEHRDEFFQRLREGATLPNDFVYAGFWVRFAAKFIDGLVLVPIGFGLNALLAYQLLGSANVFDNQMIHNHAHGGLYQVLSQVTWIVIGVSFALFFLRRFDATPGKLALGLKVLRADGAKLSKGRIVGRYFSEILSCYLLLIGYIMAAFDGQKRGLHDRICDTRVIRTR